jgi:hypothetical protein
MSFFKGDRQLRSLSWNSLLRSYSRYRIVYIVFGSIFLVIISLSLISYLFYKPLLLEYFETLLSMTKHPIFRLLREWIGLIADSVAVISAIITVISWKRAQSIKKEITHRRSLQNPTLGENT